MLEQLRQQSRSFIIWILLGIIILVFIISFGPQANAELGCGGSNTAVLTVNDHEVGEHDWRFAVNGLPQFLPNLTRGRSRQQRANIAMDMLLARELSAQEAEAAGFRISDDVINEKLQQGEWYFLGTPGGPGNYFVDGYFNFEALERFSSNLGIGSVEAFRKQQRRELLAQAARSLIIGGVHVSQEELLAKYTAENTVASIDYVRFRAINYKRITLTDAQIGLYLAENQAEVKKKYDAESVNYKATKPAVKLRQIFVALNGNRVGGDDGDDAADNAAENARSAAKTKADELHAKLTGGADFAETAIANSDDKTSAPRGGLLGWRRVDRPGLPDKKLSDAITSIETGKISPVIDTPRGFYILAVDDKREGDLSFDQVKAELADDLAVDYYASKAARADADAALALIAGGKKLDELFDTTAPASSLDSIRQQLGLPPGTSQDEILREMMKRQPKSGAVIVHGPAVPAEWQDGDQPAPPAAEPKVKPAIEAKPKAKPAVKAKAKPKAKTKAKPTPKAAGDGAATDAAKAKPKFSSPADDLPRPEKLRMPSIESAGPFGRTPKKIEGLGDSREAVVAIFEEMKLGDISPVIHQIGDDFVIIKLLSRRQPDMKEFARKQPTLLQEARLEKANDVLGQWLNARCKQVAEDGNVSVNKTFLTFQDDNGKNMPVTYQACQFF